MAVLVGRSVLPELKFPKNLDLFGTFTSCLLKNTMDEMRYIDRSRSVDAICAAQSCKRISIRDSVNCQSHEQNEKTMGRTVFYRSFRFFDD